MSKTMVRLEALFVVVVLAVGVGLAVAGPAPIPPKAIDGQSFVQALVGTWDVHATGSWGTDDGTRTYRLGAGGTVLVEDCESGSQPKFSSHGVWRVGADGKALATWWFDNMSDEVVAYKGTITDTVADYAADSASGSRRSVLTRTEGGFTLELYRNGQKVGTATYKNRRT